MGSTATKYMKHTVTIVKVSLARGRETTTEKDSPAYITVQRVIVRDVSGDHAEEKTLLFLPPDADVVEKDRIKIDDVTMPIKWIRAPRFVGQEPNHLEVLLD